MTTDYQRKKVQRKRAPQKAQAEEQDQLTPSSENADVVKMQQYVGNSGVQSIIRQGHVSRFIASKNSENIQRNLREDLDSAMEGWGTDEDAIFDAIARATPEEKRAILNDPAMISRLASELDRDDMMRALEGLNAPLKMKLNAAMDGWGTDEAAILSFTARATTAEKQEILQDTAMIQRLSGELDRDSMLTVLGNLNAPLKMKLDAAMDGWGTDEETIMTLTARATAAEKQEILQDQAMVQRLSGELSRDDMLAVLRNLDAPLEMRLNAAMDGWGTDEAAIQELLTNASEADRTAALNNTTLVARLKTELSIAEMISIFRAASVPFKRIVELAFDPWDAAIGDVRDFISAATDAECETVWSDDTLMSSIHTKLGDDNYLNFLTLVRMHRPGTTAEDGASHTHARTADSEIQTHLDEYIQGALREGRQITGMVAVVGDAEWDIAGEAEFGNARWFTAAPPDFPNGFQNSINGFVDNQGRVWIHRERGNAGTMIHEAVHKYSDEAMNGVSWALNEGVTEYFTRKVCDAVSPPITGRGNYQQNYDFIVELVNVATEATVAAAYFDGDMAGLESAVNAAKGDTAWSTILGHLNGRPLDWVAADAVLTSAPATP